MRTWMIEALSVWSSSLPVSGCSPIRANGTIRYLVELSGLVDHVNRDRLSLDHMISTTSHPLKVKREKYFISWLRPTLERILPLTCLRNSGSFDHCLCCMWRKDCYLSHTTDHSKNRQHFLRNRRFQVCNSPLPNGFWSGSTEHTFCWTGKKNCL